MPAVLGETLQDVIVEAFLPRGQALSLGGSEIIQMYNPELIRRLCSEANPDDYYYCFARVRKFEPVFTRLVFCPEAWEELQGTRVHALVR